MKEATPATKSHYRLTDGLSRQNVVLMSGTAIGPVAVFATNIERASVLASGFSLIAFFSVILCRFVPRKIVYTIRIVIYALIAGICFIPAYIILTRYYGSEAVDGIGIYLPILTLNPLILTKSETRFTLRPFHLMIIELLGYIAGFNIACMVIGGIRDILVNNKLGTIELNLNFQVSAVSTTFGGLLLVGISAGAFRWLYNKSKERKYKKYMKEKEYQELLAMMDESAPKDA